MRPLKLVMQAFGSYGNRTEIDFEKPDQNLFLITGNTGSGKTTIFDAIVFALYGEASSNANKKNGAELQSQFVEIGTEPFVSLTFSEKNGTEIDLYTVKRIPRHVRPLKRGSGEKMVSEEVSLTMPDGSEYPAKETDAKLMEIVGLTKEQFMQVAMIAQGEFMELLRAKSDDKKMIFRKLFHTGLYEEIKNEFAVRKKEKQAEIDQIRMRCIAEISRTELPEGLEQTAFLKEKKKELEKSKDFSVTVLEQFLEKLELLCEELSKRTKEAKKIMEKRSQERDHARDAAAKASQLLKSFVQLEDAEKTLQSLKEQEEAITEQQELAVRVEDAWEVQAVYQRLLDCKKMLEKLRSDLQEQTEQLPNLMEDTKLCIQNTKNAKHKQEEEVAAFTKVAEKVRKAIEVFEKMEAAKMDVIQKEKAVQNADEKERALKAKKEQLEKQQEAWRERSQQLAQSEKNLALWQAKQKDFGLLETEFSRAEQTEKEYKIQKQTTEKRRLAYQKASLEFEEKNAVYEQKRKIFLNAQAGFLAQELKEGCPCPVCGSTDHPSPCKLEEEHQNLTKEMIEELALQAEQLRGKQEQAAAAAEAAGSLLEEKQKNAGESFEHLRSRANEVLGLEEMSDFSGMIDTAEKADFGKTTVSDQKSDFEKICTDFLKWMKDELLQQNKKLEAEGRQLQKEVNEYQMLLSALTKAEKQKEQFQEKLEQSAKETADAKTALERSRVMLESLEGSKDYQNQQEAQAAYAKADTAKKEKDILVMRAEERLQKAQEQENRAQTLIAKYKKEIPQQMEEQKIRQQAYREILEEKHFPEMAWMELTGTYTKTQVQKWKQDAQNHGRQKAAAESLINSARAAIGEQPKPVLEELEKTSEAAEAAWKESQRVLEQWQEIWRIDQKVCQALKPQMEERSEVMHQYEKLNGLYQLLSGNKKNSRMDIETYVQRHYLEQILEAANQRFQDMSAGQFELRMCDIDKAGTGKNRGLDLMVYSAVTGKVREVRTLSGGESFMAALSLALGMADQIQESSAAINLDMMFIDEGFGSLDEHSRDQAVKVLQNMAEGEKLIGIISHVTELKQEIEDQLIVTKDDQGSHTRWQIS